MSRVKGFGVIGKHRHLSSEEGFPKRAVNARKRLFMMAVAIVSHFNTFLSSCKTESRSFISIYNSSLSMCRLGKNLLKVLTDYFITFYCQECICWC